jgi:hypothetical protein
VGVWVHGCLSAWVQGGGGCGCVCVWVCGGYKCVVECTFDLFGLFLCRVYLSKELSRSIDDAVDLV